MGIILLWILGTLMSVTVFAVLGKKYEASILIGIYASLVVMAQIFAGKLVMFGPFIVPGAVVVYAITYLMTDALVEFYGKKEAQKAIYAGLVGSLLLVLGIQLLLKWQAAPFFEHQEAFVLVLSNTWRIVVASIISYLISQSMDVWSYNAIKEKTKGKHLWLRNNGSTMTSQIVDTIIFIGIAFVGTMPGKELLLMMVGQYSVKFIIALLDTPFLYFMRWVYTNNNQKHSLNETL